MGHLPMAMRLEHLHYFKELLEGRAEVSWHAWFRAHERELAAELSRADFLRLKFDKISEAERQLAAAQIAYSPDPLVVRRERYYALMHPSVLDERGRPKEEFSRRAYGGALGQLLDGDHDAGRATLTAFAKKLRRMPLQRRAEELAGLTFDGEIELTLGNPVIGRVLLEAVLTIPRGNDLLDPAIDRALELLRVTASKRDEP